VPNAWHLNLDFQFSVWILQRHFFYWVH
jgi:hypothetical protein